MKQVDKDVLKSWFKTVWYVGAPIAFPIFFMNMDLFQFLIAYPWVGLFALAAFFNAIMDSVENEHILSTRFAALPGKFWSKLVSWNTAKKLFGYKFDAWHLSKSAMVICIAFSLLLYKQLFGFWIDFLLIGCLWNHTFNGFYSNLFVKKK